MSPTWHEEAKTAFAVDHNSARACHRGRLRKAREAGRQYRVDNPRPDAPSATKRRVR